MVKLISNVIYSKYFSVILRIIMFIFLSKLIDTPLRIFVEVVIEGKKGAPDFITIGFILYSFCAEFVIGLGYIIFGYMLPIKNTVFRAFSYIMLIFFSSYLPNILAMLGGDGYIIRSSLSFGIIFADTISYLFKGLILGFLMKNYYVKRNIVINHSSTRWFILLCIINGILFTFLNFSLDIFVGSINSSWRLCNILGVTSGCIFSFYIVFIIFMFIAGLIQPIWYRYCFPVNNSLLNSIFFALKLSFVVWLPNVLIMIFFGTSCIKTLFYCLAYVFMIMVCVLVYRKLNTFKKNMVRKINFKED